MEATQFILSLYYLSRMIFRNVYTLVSYYPSLQVKNLERYGEKLLTKCDFIDYHGNQIFFAKQIYFSRLLSFSPSNI